MEPNKDTKKKIKIRSLIKQFISSELYFDIYKMTQRYDIDNNSKQNEILALLQKYNVEFMSLGTGTNRMGILIDGYAFKIALDVDGMVDNRREFLYTEELQPYVIKVYECIPNGLIAVSEYVRIFESYNYREYQDEMRRILKDISSRFLIGDVGVTGKNYINWGIRVDGTICMMDFAYIYSVQYKLFTCSCDDETLLHYDNDYNKLICPRCGRSYKFGEIRQKVTRKKQEEEIGDIRRLGYISHQPEELVDENINFSPKIFKETKKKIKSPIEKAIDEYIKSKKPENQQDWDYPDQDENF